MELQPDAPRHLMLEEQILALDAEWRLDQCAKDWRTWGGFKLSMPKCFTSWDTSLCPYMRETGLSEDEARLVMNHLDASTARLATTPLAQVEDLQGGEVACASRWLVQNQ